jgi:predicted nucleic acid-binding protein
MAYLIDSGVLLRLVDRNDARHTSILRAVQLLRARGERLVIAVQNVSEFWNVSTRPTTARGGYGLTVRQVEARVRTFERLFELVHLSPDVYAEWRRLLVAHDIIGVSVHDAKLVALMIVHGVQNILTLNGTDFRRYGVVTPVDPAAVVASP